MDTNVIFSRCAYKVLMEEAINFLNAKDCPNRWTINQAPDLQVLVTSPSANFDEYDVEKTCKMNSWWMDAPFSDKSDKDLAKLVFSGFYQSSQTPNRFYPVINAITDGEKLTFDSIHSFIKDFHTEIDVFNNGTYTPSEYKTSTETVRNGTKQIPQTQYSTKYVTRENPYNHLSGSREFETKEVVTKHTTYKTVDNYTNQTRSYWTNATLDQYFYFESCSEEETADFAKVLQNQAEIEELYNKHENIGSIHLMEKKKIREKIHKLFEFNYYVIGKAFVDRVTVDFNEEIAAIERWISYEKNNHRRLKKDFNTHGLGYHGLEDYGHVVSHNHSALPKAKKRKAEIDACYAEICNKIASLRNI